MPKQQKIIYKVYILKNLISSSTEIFHSDFELFKSLVTGNTSSNIGAKEEDWQKWTAKESEAPHVQFLTEIFGKL
jgi:hypothetical protein